MTARSWGKILVGVRLEKYVEPDHYVSMVEFLLRRTYRKGDGVTLVRDRISHKALNDLVRALFKSDCDTLATVDSDAVFGPDWLETLREDPKGQEYDALQAFYCRRGWPPQAIWMKISPIGDLTNAFVLQSGDPPYRPFTDDVGVVGTHVALFRRELFEKIFEKTNAELVAGGEEAIPLEKFDFFFYPRHVDASEDGAFSGEIRKNLGARLGATTALKVGHVARVVTGWETYQEWLELSGEKARLEVFNRLVGEVSTYLSEDPDLVRAKALRGSANVKDGLELAGEPQKTGSAQDLRAFYGNKASGYLYELILWNASRLYQQTVAPLRKVQNSRVLVVGGGIGGEVEALLESGSNDVDVFELPGALRKFLEWKFAGKGVGFLYEPTLVEAAKFHLGDYALIVSIDTIEHFHPEDFYPTLDAFRDLLSPFGSIYVRNNFAQFDIYPMHFDHAAAWEDWISSRNLRRRSIDEPTKAEWIQRIYLEIPKEAA